MTFPSYSDSPSSPTKYLGQSYRFAPVYIRQRDPANGTDGTPFTSPDIRPKENQGYYPVGSFWVNKTLNRLWSCTSFGVDSGNHTCAHWELIESSGITGVEQFLLPDASTITPTGIPPGVTFQNGAGISITQGTDLHSIKIINTGAGTETVTGDDTVAVSPTGGTIKILGKVVANATNAKAVFTEHSGAANQENIDVQLSAAIGATDVTKVGLSAFDNTQFAVDANGFVTLIGASTAPVLGITPDAHTAPGTTPVIPDGSGNIKLEGGATFATGTQANPIRTNSLAANTIDLQIQLAGSNAAVSTANDFGVAQFDSNSFGVASGFVTLKNGGTTGAVTGVLGDDAGGNTVVPNGSGTIILDGVTVTNGTNAKAVFFKKNAVNTEELDVQVTTTSTSGAKDITKSGLAHFDSASFTVDAATGFVSLAAGGTDIQTLTGNSGGAIPPTAGNINTLGTGSITIAGAGSTLTTQLTGLTNHAVLVGAGTATITNIAATANTGAVLQNNAGADPSYSTATYPSTTTINQLLFSSSTNVVAGLATANNGVLTTGTSGTPVITPLNSNGQVIIGSSGGAPAAALLTAGSGISIVNGSNSITISNTGAAMTWTDEAVSFNASSNNGYFVTAIATATLPPTPSQGDVIKIVSATASVVTILANAGQAIRVGNVVSAVAGTAKSTKIGDSMELVFRASDKIWYAYASPVGAWGIT